MNILVETSARHVHVTEADLETCLLYTSSYVNTTNISTKFDISLRMLSCSSKDGAVLRRATLKILLLLSPPSKSVVLPFGCSFIDVTI